MIKPRHLLTTFFAFLLIVTPLTMESLWAHHGINDDHAAEAERSEKATDILTAMMDMPEGIPEELMARARGIVVIPNVVKGAFGFGGQYGKGLISQRLKDGSWSPPAYIDIGGGSFGAQIGVQSTDLVLVFTNDEGIESLLRGRLKLGADASAAAGPVGRKAQVGTDVLMRSAILSYSRSRGLFAGVSLDGSVLLIDDSANREVYGQEVDAGTILSGDVPKNPLVEPFMAALTKYSPATPKLTE